MITEAYCSFEVAKLLKEKGFEGECIAYYSKYKDNNLNLYRWRNRQTYVNVRNNSYTLVPTHQMAMKWLREEKNILIYVYPVINLPVKDDNTFHWRWDGKKKIHCAPHIGDKHNYESYEEAVEAALKYALENLI